MTSKYVFDVTAINANAVLEQVADALEKRTELVSRSKNPKIWAYTDKLNSKERVSKQVSKKRKLFRKIMSVINLLLGIFLFIPGLMDPKELKVALFVGAFAIIVSLIVLFSGNILKKNDFIEPARKLLANKDKIIPNENQIIFLDEHMELHTISKTNVCITYSEFEYVIETKDIFLITYNGMITVLQKSDLQENDLQDFCEFIIKKAKFITLITNIGIK